MKTIINAYSNISMTKYTLHSETVLEPLQMLISTVCLVSITPPPDKFRDSIKASSAMRGMAKCEDDLWSG